MCDIDQVISQIHFNLLTFTAGVTVVFFFFNAYIYFFMLSQEVVDFCRTHLTVNHDAFCHKKLNLVIDDAK